MSQTKYKLPEDLKIQCVSLVRGYERRVLLYHERRNNIIYASAPPNIITFKDKKGNEIGEFGGRGNDISDSTYNKTLELEKIETLFDTEAMIAVEQAKLVIGLDWNEAKRQGLTKAIWDSCTLGRNFKFNHYDLPIGRDNFYERRRQFLWHIANNMGFL